jgi:isopenicillin N synthase-like dioxygenase
MVGSLYLLWSSLTLSVAVKNHAIPEEVIQEAIASSKEFFSLNIDVKMKVSSNLNYILWSIILPVLQLDNKKTPNFKGYQPLLSGNSNPENDGDMHEGFEFGWEELEDTLVNSKANDGDGVMGGANVWPEGLPRFRRAALEY